jgi:AcrR family transcriptional regulator
MPRTPTASRKGTARRSPQTGAPKKPEKDSKTPRRRMGPEDSDARRALLDVGEKLLREAGFAAVTSRRIAKDAGVHPTLVHYYFKTMDDLFQAIWHRYAERKLLRLSQALAAPQPLRAIWEFSCDTTDVALANEFMTLARNGSLPRDDMSRFGELIRGMETQRFREIIAQYGLETSVSPAFLSAVITALARLLMMEREVGITRSHDDIFAHLDQWLARIEGPRKA